MISLKNISISYGKRAVLNNINLDLPKMGFYALVGKSGSGKTTLLNILAGLETSYQGTYYFQKKDLGRKKDYLTSFRLLNIGYLFQDFRLFENETVFNNIVLPLEVATNETNEEKIKLIKYLLNLVGLSSFLNKEVRHLSGGEKQRVALVRALINRPQIILCDEATGALDQKTAKEIMLILQKLSKHYLIIFASHDEDLVNEYCQTKLFLKNGTLKKQELNNYKNEHVTFAFPLLNKKREDFVIPLFTKIKRAFSIFKIRKTRLILNNLIMSMGLFGAGLAVLLTTSMNEKIQESFMQVMKPNMIVMSSKEDLPSLSRKYSANFKNVAFIQQRYATFVEYIGVTYQTPFETFFHSCDEFFISSTTYKTMLPRFSSRQIHDFFVLGEKEDESELLPNYKADYNNDELVIGLPYNDMFALCFALKIERSFFSLGQYIKAESPLVTFSVANDEWQYEDEQVFHLSGVMETNEICLFHTNPLWSEYVFEEKMRLPSIDHFQPSLPWEISKTYYLKCYLDPSYFLEKTINDELISAFLFECASQKHFPTHTLNNPTKLLNRLLVYHLDYKHLNVSLLPNIVKNEKNLKNFYYTSDKGYYYHPNSFLMG
ncbi:MAG: ABC transporter ATP-binding protein [Bacilli bacterium]|jgi:ABC-type lipoprotein export system ATPase subunit|nr:ABC transporter ATP-binding protein [Bacilli bacterium]